MKLPFCQVRAFNLSDAKGRGNQRPRLRLEEHGRSNVLTSEYPTKGSVAVVVAAGGPVHLHVVQIPLIDSKALWIQVWRQLCDHFWGFQEVGRNSIAGGPEHQIP